MVTIGNKSHYITGFLTGLLLISCKPEYPNCEVNNHCRNAKNSSDVCVNGLCQECLEDAQCVALKGENYYCNSGRCDLGVLKASTCSSDADCTEGHFCQNNQCTEGTARQSCIDDVECGSNSACIAGFCNEGAESAEQAAKRECLEIFSANAKPIAVNFNFNNSELTATGQEFLAQTAQCLQKLPNINLQVEGHCDDRGTQEYNLALGEQRAQAVIQYLRNLGITPVRLNVGTKGENELKCMNTTESCHAQNRRVELKQLRN